MSGGDRRNFCKTVSYSLVGGLAAFPRSAEAKTSGEEMDPRSRDSTFFQTEKKVKEVIARVLSQKGTCGLGHKVGDTVRFTEAGVQGKICIHALYSMLPAVFAMLFEARFPWLQDPDTKTHACPDAYNPVVFEISRVWDGGG
jgi:uncharacterized repeat protein (TIGR04076 family)